MPPNILINLTTIGETIALPAIAFLLLIWIRYDRRMWTFLATATGVAVLVEIWKYNGDALWLERAIIVTVAIGLMVQALYWMERARRRRTPVYVPKKAREA